MKLVRLRDFSFELRIAVSCLALVIGGGYTASLYFMSHHVGRKDGQEGLTVLDVEGTYHGVNRPARLLVVLEDDSQHRKDYVKGMPTEEVELLRSWLKLTEPSALQEQYDELPEDAPEEALAPADVIDERCTRCHSPGAKEGDGIGATVPPHNLPAVEKVAYSKKLDPISVDILAQSTHAHALSIPVFTLIAAGMLLMTAWPRWFRHGVVMLCFLGLLADFAGMWLARLNPGFVWLLLGGGAVYGAALVTALLAGLVDMWFGRPSPPPST